MARIGSVGDRIIVMAFAEFTPEELDGHSPRVVALDARNRAVELIPYPPIHAPVEGVTIRDFGNDRKTKS